MTSKPVCDFYIDDIALQSSIPTLVTHTSITERFAYISNGKIIFTTNENSPFAVYNINGYKMAEGIANTANPITLPRGVYIVKMKNMTQKVVL